MATAATGNNEILSQAELYNILKQQVHAKYDQVYRTLLAKPEYLTLMPNDEDYAILHYIVMNGALDLFNKVLTIPNLRLILLMRTATQPPKDVLDIAKENQGKSNEWKKLYEEIDRLVTLDKFVEYAKNNSINECKNMLLQDDDLANLKPPYRKYYLIHHLAYSNNKHAFDQLRQYCTFKMDLLTFDEKTASEVAIEQKHHEFARYLESLSPEMRAIRESHEKKRQRQAREQENVDRNLEKKIKSVGGDNMLACFTCPLTKEIFHDPVILSDGFTYERSAIQQWLDLGNQRSPMTNILLTNTTLVPNFVIKQALTEISGKEKK